jgi:probable rRNA maturation factor
MILDRQRTVHVALRPLELFAGRLCKALGVRRTEATICLVTDAEIARMNERFRKKKGPTDVLSFPAEGEGRPARPAIASGRVRRGGKRRDRRSPSTYLGDIAISPATARRNALENGHPLDAELRILILHGLLHLLGYDHETDQGQMSRIEQRLRRRFRLA